MEKDCSKHNLGLVNTTKLRHAVLTIFFFSLSLGHFSLAASANIKCESSVSSQTIISPHTQSDRAILKRLIQIKRSQIRAQKSSANEPITYQINGESYKVDKKISNNFNVTTVFLTTDGKRVLKDYNFDKKGENIDYFYRELLLLEYLKSKGVPVLEPTIIDQYQKVLIRPYYTVININFEKGQNRSSKIREALESAGDREVQLSPEFTKRLEAEIERVLSILRILYDRNERATHPMLGEIKDLFNQLKKKYPETILAEDTWLLKADYYNPGNLVLVVSENGIGIRLLDP